MQQLAAIRFAGCGDSTHRCRRMRHRGQALNGERIYNTGEMNRFSVALSRQMVVESPTPTKGIENLNDRGKFFGKITKNLL